MDELVVEVEGEISEVEGEEGSIIEEKAEGGRLVKEEEGELEWEKESYVFQKRRSLFFHLLESIELGRPRSEPHSRCA